MINEINPGITEKTLAEYNQLITKKQFEEVFTRTSSFFGQDYCVYLDSIVNTARAIYCNSPEGEKKLAMHFRDLIVELCAFYNVNKVESHVSHTIESNNFIGAFPHNGIQKRQFKGDVSLAFTALNLDCYCNYSNCNDESSNLIQANLVANGHLIYFDYDCKEDQVVVFHSSDFDDEVGFNDLDLPLHSVCSIAVDALYAYYNAEFLGKVIGFPGEILLQLPKHSTGEFSQDLSETASKVNSFDETTVANEVQEIPEFESMKPDDDSSGFIANLKKLFI